MQFVAPTLSANEPGCDGLHWLDGTVFRYCCDVHDLCYAKVGCTYRAGGGSGRAGDAISATPGQWSASWTAASTGMIGASIGNDVPPERLRRPAAPKAGRRSTCSRRSHLMTWLKNLVLGAAAFVAAHAVEVYRWRDWFDPQAATTVVPQHRRHRADGRRRGPRRGRRAMLWASSGREAGRQSFGVAGGAALAMATTLFVIGPGNIFPIVLSSEPASWRSARFSVAGSASRQPRRSALSLTAETAIVPLSVQPLTSAPNGTGHRRTSQEDAAQRPPSRLRRQDGAVRRLGHARRVLGHRRPSTWPCATRAGLFDVSHMGEIEIAGKDALAAVQRISSNDASKLQVGQAQYSGLLTAAGHVRRRPARLPPRAGALPARRQRRQHREGLRLDRRADHSRPATPSPSTRARATRCSPFRGPRRSTSCSR